MRHPGLLALHDRCVPRAVSIFAPVWETLGGHLEGASVLKQLESPGSMAAYFQCAGPFGT